MRQLNGFFSELCTNNPDFSLSNNAVRDFFLLRFEVTGKAVNVRLSYRAMAYKDDVLVAYQADKLFMSGWLTAWMKRVRVE